MLLRIFVILCLLLGYPASWLYAQENGSGLTLASVQKVWDKAPHNAFTDLIRFEDQWFLVFREGESHISPDGSLRILTSSDGDTWRSAAHISSPSSDLRDAKFSVTPAGQLMLIGVEALHNDTDHTHQSLAWYSDDGFSWSKSHQIGDPDFWIWRLTWHRDTAYGIGYSVREDNRSIRLYTSKDGRTFDTLVESVYDNSYANETSIVFDDDTALCLLRRDGTPSSGLLGVSLPPYTNWEWKDLGDRLGGPHMTQLPDGRFVVASRVHRQNGESGQQQTALFWLEPTEGELIEALILPSGGDTSYPGLVLHEGQLWMSYYSSHEDRAAIYLARIDIGQ